MKVENGVMKLTVKEMLYLEEYTFFSKSKPGVPFEVVYENGKKHKDSDDWVEVVKNYNEQREIFEHLFKTRL